MWEGIEEEIDFSTAYGIITDQPLITNEEYCRYEAAIEEPAPGTITRKTIFGRKYARFVHHGNFEHLLDAYGVFYRFWLAEEPFLLDNSPVIEEYLLSESGSIQLIFISLYIYKIAYFFCMFRVLQTENIWAVN